MLNSECHSEELPSGLAGDFLKKTSERLHSLSLRTGQKNFQSLKDLRKRPRPNKFFLITVRRIFTKSDASLDFLFLFYQEKRKSLSGQDKTLLFNGILKRCD